MMGEYVMRKPGEYDSLPIDIIAPFALRSQEIPGCFVLFLAAKIQMTCRNVLSY